MVTGELRSKVDRVWDAFWSGGIANPVEVIEQITYLLFIRRLDEIHTREERKANRTGKAMERRVFPEVLMTPAGCRARTMTCAGASS